MIDSTAARAWSCAAPTTAKKILVDSTSKLPPSTSGLPKSAMLSTKPSRNALARPGRDQRQRDGAERRPALGAQRLRGFLERRADALHDADQHQKGDRREREQLRDARCPAGRRSSASAECRTSRPAAPVTVPERPNSRISARPMTKGGVMIGRMVEHAQRALEAQAGARRDQREGKAERGRADADQDARGTACSRQRRSAGSTVMQSRPQTERSKNLATKSPSAERAGIVLDAR